MQGYPRQLELNEKCEVAEVTRAVRAEHRRAARCARLRATRVVDHGDGLYQLTISGFPALDWTWEGASAFRPVDLGDDDGGEGERRVWEGEIVGIEPDESALFVASSSAAERGPCVGWFVAKPFDYLEVLLDVLTAPDLRPAQRDLGAAFANAQSMDGGGRRPGIGRLPVRDSLLEWSWAALWGPPGTGKTYTVGQLVSRAAEAGERVLVVSTTNKATDEAALQVGRGLGGCGMPLSTAVRLGPGAEWDRYEAHGFTELVQGGETDLRRQLAEVKTRLRACHDPIERARLSRHKAELARLLADAGGAFCDTAKSVVLCTAYGALRRLTGAETRAMVAAGRAPFTLVILDEAGLLSCAVTGVLSLLAARRMLLVGDPRQLAPISRTSRVLAPTEARWLASSGLTKLSGASTSWPNVHQLTSQYRMAPAIRNVVSAYQYEGRLTDADEVLRRPDKRGARLADQPRTIWYVLDEDPGEHLAAIRAVRGAGNRSWVRSRTWELVDRILKAHPEIASGPGLFISPFAAQSRQIRRSLAEAGYSGWTASTVHAQQGAEADYVIFDTVHAGSTGWPFDEWKRLVNVALSRAREQVIVFASRAEMQEPYLADVADLLAPRVLQRGVWRPVERAVVHQVSLDVRADPQSLGAQLERRKALRPVLSGEQERLCAYKMDGRPRLVRGVAGSGKTYVLAHWLARTVAAPDFRGKAWVLYANQSLRSLLERSAREAWAQNGGAGPFPDRKVDFLHIKDVLDVLARQAGIWVSEAERFDFDMIAKKYLARVPREKVPPICDALFIDEAQDFGHHTLELCFALVAPSNGGPKSRAAMVFYDNVQDVYGRGTPTWAQLGLDVTGRSFIMKESFRSTWPINEFSLNVLYRLYDPSRDPEYRELTQRDLVEEQQRGDRPWWRINFNRVDGPLPMFRRFPDREREIEGAASQVMEWIKGEGISPQDIKVLCNGSIRAKVVETLTRRLQAAGVRVVHETSTTFTEQDDTLVVSTAHSFKGYEAEAVVIPCADRFAAKRGDALASALYVAMTRARSLLYVSAIERAGNGPERRVVDALMEVDSLIRGALPAEAIALEGKQAAIELLQEFPQASRDWLTVLTSRYAVVQEPILDERGAIVAEPRFWFKAGDRTYAHFEVPPDTALRHDLEDHGIDLLAAGDVPREVGGS